MRPERVLPLLLILLSACGESVPVDTDPALDPDHPYQISSRVASALHLVGEIRGPALGLGPEVQVEAWIRSDRWVRADLRFEDENGEPAHEVLVWGPDTCLLFDRRRGKYTELGHLPGELELDRGSFRVQHALWLALGLWVGDSPLEGAEEGREWRARDEGLGLRAQRQGEILGWTELVWRGERLRSTPKERENSAWGRIPARLELSGTLLESVVKAEWRVESIGRFGDEALNPLLDP